MEGEINNLIVVWLTICASLCYCHSISKFIPKGTNRLLALLPIVCLFLILPLNLSTIHLGGITCFFVAWLANFKLLLFAFGKGPLCSNPPLPLSTFIPMACLPIKLYEQKNPSPKHIAKKTVVNYAIKIFLMGILIKLYDYIDNLNAKVIILIYCVHIYFMLELLLAMAAVLGRTLVQIELEPQFDEPYLSTSLQDFWGKRWNLMVTSILRPTVYDPVRSMSIRAKIPRKWAPLPAVLATYFVSGIMHELIFYYLGRWKPTGEVTCFFIIQGVCLCLEIEMKKVVGGRFRLPPVVSGLLAVAFVVVTSFWFFFPPFLRFNPDLRACRETVALFELVFHGRYVSPEDVNCPFV